MLTRVGFFSLLIVFKATFAVTAAPKKPNRRTEVIIFIDSAHLAQKKMVREINHQLFYSRLLQRRMNVTFIDINRKGELFHGPANYLRDDAGEWVEKYRPEDIPTLFCVRDKKLTRKKIVSARELRTCL